MSYEGFMIKLKEIYIKKVIKAKYFNNYFEIVVLHSAKIHKT